MIIIILDRVVDQHVGRELLLVVAAAHVVDPSGVHLIGMRNLLLLLLLIIIIIIRYGELTRLARD